MKIALAGNPNSGKTTLFNAITGRTEYVGNWAGVTVEKKEADLRQGFRHIVACGRGGGRRHGFRHVIANGQGHEQPCGSRHHVAGGHGGGHRRGCHHNLAGGRVVDLPGAYSISPYTGEEAITRDFVLDEHPDVILNIVDAASLERSLFFTTQLLELGIPVVVALNKQDLVRRHGSSIDIAGIASALRCPVVSTVANEGEGLHDLMHAVASVFGGGQPAPEFPGKGGEQEDIARQQYVKAIVGDHFSRSHSVNEVTFGDRLDRILAHGVFGLPIFALIMWGIYSVSIEGVGGFLSGWLNETLFGEIIPDAVNGFLLSLGVHPLMQALIVDGAIAGVGAVIGFLPLIMILFFFLALLEDSGYMARVAVVMDRYFKKFGLSGKSIIPMIVGSGCSIPGVMATRTIEDENERRMTTILTPFVPCGAKLPIIALFSVVFFPESAWVAPSVYLLAFGMIVIGGLLLKRIFVWESTSSFIMELPEYRLPSLKHAFHSMLNQAKAFLVKASTIILVMNTLIWLMQTFNWRFQPVSDASTSMLAAVGGFVSPLLIPLGFVGWQLAASSLSGFVAKENVVATFAIILGIASEEALHSPGGALTGFFTPVTAYAFLAFNLFTPPCFAAIGAMNAEFGNKKWLFKALAFQFSVGYLVAMFITQVGTLVFYGQPASGAVPAVIVAILAVFMILLTIRRADAARNRLLTPAYGKE